MRKENNFFCVEILPCRPLERISVQQAAVRFKRPVGRSRAHTRFLNFQEPVHHALTCSTQYASVANPT
jgi:hypothetical protein